MIKEKVFRSFGKLLHVIAEASMPLTEVRNYLVKNCEVDDLLLLADVFYDILKMTEEKK